MICSRCRMLTVISYTFMYTLNVSFKMSWYRCSIPTFVIIISNSIVFTRHCTCILREPTVAAVYLHWLQEYLTPSCLRSMCLLRSLSWVVAYLYLSQGYLMPSCLLSTCFLRLPAVAEVFSHLSHEYLGSSYLLSIWLFSLLRKNAMNSHLSQGYLPSSSFLFLVLLVPENRVSPYED